MAAPEQPSGPLGWLARRRAERARTATARALYHAVVARARRPGPYARLGVPDTPDGRFEMLGLEVALLLRRLRGLGSEGELLGRSLLEVMVQDLDRNLREMGVGDLSVGRWVKRMTASVMARAAALDAALAAAEPGALEALVARALFPDGPPPAGADPAGLAEELRAEAARLAHLPAETLLAGRLDGPGAGRDPESR